VGDIVEFDLLGDTEAPRQLTISSDGGVQVPMLGAVNIAGMSTSAAIEKLRQAYIAEQLYLDPEVTLSVATYRPIFVLGDVRTPGTIPFYPHLKVDEAVGLAGGPVTNLGEQESPILARARLRAELEEIGSELIRQAIWRARLLAQLDGRTEIASSDLPDEVKAHANELFTRDLQRVEERTLAVEIAAFGQQKALSTEAIAEAEREHSLLEDLAENQRATIQFSRAELERFRGLQERGLTTSSEVGELEQHMTAEEGRLLQILAQISNARRGIATLKQALSELDEGRTQTHLAQLQERQVEIAKLQSRRRSLEDQLLLLSGLTTAWEASGRTMKIDYRIRRRTGADVELLSATGGSELSPGDAVVVAVELPATGTTVGQ
jgi:exopolysaccharide production protein ExoF